MKIEMPTPTEQQIQRSQRCMQLITNAIKSAQGSIGFDEYMNLCLYSEQVGYYESSDEIFGSGGDFTTSPERSPYFASAFASYIRQLHPTMSNITVLEIGAGSGKFANDLITCLHQMGCMPNQYIVVEKSAALRRRQQQALAQHSDVCEIKWLRTLQQPIENAVVIANEVLDALPVKLLALRNNSIRERRVGINDDGALAFVENDVDKDLQDLLQARLPKQVLVQNECTYNADINLHINNFVEEIASFVKQGIFFYIDYGYPRSEYYHEQRHMGTLICHFKHAANDQPLLWPGLQDISCSVDFTAVAEAADNANLQVNCYTTQAHFLLASKLLENVKAGDFTAGLDEQAELKRLLMPGEMGERFQVMVLGKNVDLSAHQFTTRDLLHRL